MRLKSFLETLILKLFLLTVLTELWLVLLIVVAQHTWRYTTGTSA